MHEALLGIELHWEPSPGRVLEGAGFACGEASSLATCQIVPGGVPEQLELPRLARGLWQADEVQALFHFPGVVRFQVAHGRLVSYQLDPAADAADLRVFVLGAALPMLLQQRDARVVRGTAVQMGDGALVLLGPSGSGKSTVAAALLQEGATLVSDGWLVIRADGDGRERVLPGLSTLRLFRDAAQMLAWPAEEARTCRREAGGLSFHVSQVATAAVPLQGFVVLDSQRGSGVVERLPSLQAVASLTSESPLLHLQPGSRIKRVLRDLGAVAARLPMFALKRGDLTVRETARRIREAVFL